MILEEECKWTKEYKLPESWNDYNEKPSYPSSFHNEYGYIITKKQFTKGASVPLILRQKRNVYIYFLDSKSNCPLFI